LRRNVPRRGRTKGGLNSKLRAICDSKGRPRTLFLTAGRVSDYTGVAALLSSLPPAKALYRKRHKIETIFGKLKDWPRIHTRCAHTFMSAIAAIVIFWI
jgi:transposase